MKMMDVWQLVIAQTRRRSEVSSWMWVIPVLVILLIALANALRFLKDDERGVVLRNGKFHATKGPGICFIIPWTDRMTKVSVGVTTMELPTQEVITKDIASASVDTVIHFRIAVPERAILEVADYLQSTSQATQTALREVSSQVKLYELLSAGKAFNSRLRARIEELTGQWGVEVTEVELKQVKKVSHPQIEDAVGQQ